MAGHASFCDMLQRGGRRGSPAIGPRSSPVSKSIELAVQQVFNKRLPLDKPTVILTVDQGLGQLLYSCQ